MADQTPDKDLLIYQKGGPDLAGACGHLATKYLAEGEFAKSYLFAKKADNSLIMADCLNVMGKYAKAEKLAKEIIKKSPKNRPGHIILGQAQGGLEDFEGAVKSFKAALDLGPGDGAVLIDVGLGLEPAGDTAGANAHFDRAKIDHPDLFEQLMNKADLLFKVSQYKAARRVLQKAEKVARKDARAYYEMGLANFIMGFAGEAEKLFLTSIRLRPILEAYRELAACYEKSNNLKKAEAFIRGGLQGAPEDPSLNLIMAHCERRTGREDEALARYKKIVDEADYDPVRIEALNQMGCILDKKGDVETAYKNFTQGKDLSKQEEKFETIDIPAQHRNIRTLAARDWSQQTLPVKPFEAGFTPRELVFFIGFPRSGTTLIQEVLAGHGEVVVTSEERILRTIVDLLEGFEGDYPDALANLTTEQIDDFRALYFYQANTCATFDEKTTLVDKLPLNLMQLPLILTLFPEAKIIFALRHPMACTLSCLMQNFRLNNAMVNMVGLNEITSYYALLMGMWQKISTERDLPFHYVKYEDVVGNMEAEAKKLTEFLDIPWQSNMLDYAKNAKAKGLINTPSYHQVVQPVYSDSMEKWRAYEKYLAPFKERLTPFYDMFGYSG